MPEDETYEWLRKRLAPKIEKLQKRYDAIKAEDYDTPFAAGQAKSSITREMNKLWKMLEHQSK